MNIHFINSNNNNNLVVIISIYLMYCLKRSLIIAFVSDVKKTCNYQLARIFSTRYSDCTILCTLFDRHFDSIFFLIPLPLPESKENERNRKITNPKINSLFFLSLCNGGVMVKAMNCGIVVREFVLQSRYYVHFRANTLGKGMNPLILPPAMGK